MELAHELSVVPWLNEKWIRMVGIGMDGMGWDGMVLWEVLEVIVNVKLQGGAVVGAVPSSYLNLFTDTHYSFLLFCSVLYEYHLAKYY